MKKTTIYPITTKNCYLLNFLNESDDDFSINSAVIPKAFNHLKCKKNITVFNSIDAAISNTDHIIFLPQLSKNRLKFEMENALNAGKDVTSVIGLSTEEEQKYRSISGFNNSRFDYYDDRAFMREIELRNEPYQSPESVVIVVGAITANLDTSSMALSLKKQLSEKGYNTTLIASDPTIRFLGNPLLPLDLIVSPNLEKTVVSINQFVNYIQLIYHPDIIIVQLPNEGMLRTSNELGFGFGARTFLISQAIGVDYSLMISPFMGLDDEGYSSLSNLSMLRFGFEYDSIMITNKTFSDIENQTIDYYEYINGQKDLDIQSVVEKLNMNNRGMLYLQESMDWDKVLTSNILSKLS